VQVERGLGRGLLEIKGIIDTEVGKVEGGETVVYQCDRGW